MVDGLSGVRDGFFDIKANQMYQHPMVSIGNDQLLRSVK